MKFPATTLNDLSSLSLMHSLNVGIVTVCLLNNFSVNSIASFNLPLFASLDVALFGPGFAFINLESSSPNIWEYTDDTPAYTSAFINTLVKFILILSVGLLFLA